MPWWQPSRLVETTADTKVALPPDCLAAGGDPRTVPGVADVSVYGDRDKVFRIVAVCPKRSTAA